MMSFVSVLFDKFVSFLSKEIGDKLANKIKEKYGHKIIDKLSSYFSKKEKLIRKLLLIGGGEIGTEIGLAALNRGWHVRAICCERDYPHRLDEKTLVPIKNLPFYRSERINEKRHFYYTGEKASLTEPFQWTVFEELEIDILKEMILRERPDVVLLEDMFLTAEQWKNLHRVVLGELKDKEHIFFIPSTEEMGHQDKTYSDIFLSKIKMKEFLTEIGLQGYLLGKKDEYVLAQHLAKERGSTEYLNEANKVKKALKDHRSKIILKFDIISSGHGQFILSDISFLNPEMVKESLEYAKHRVPNDFYVLEKYLDNKEEVCAIVARTKEKKVGLNRIYYKKYDMEKIKSRRFRWVTRLVTSESKTKGDNNLWLRLDKIVEKISKKLPVPFLYVEFLVKRKSKQKPGIYINEISYRPDDAGFVSCISHPKDQFGLFIESLEKLLEKEELKAIDEEIEYIEPRGEFACVTINPGKKPEFLADNVTWPLRGSPLKTNFKLSLYEKHLYEKNGEIDYGRIVGYVWHSSGEYPKKLLNEFKSSLGLDEETFKIIFDTLSEAEQAETHG